MNNDKLISLAEEVRNKILEISKKVKCAHIGSNLSLVEILISLQASNKYEEVCLSKGHASLCYYIVMNYFNLLSDEALDSFYQNGTNLCSHPTYNLENNIKFTSGALGHGLPFYVGKALANPNKNYAVIIGDGEFDEGSIRETISIIARYKDKLKNLQVFIDNNKLQGLEFNNNVLNIDFEAVLKAYKLNVITIDGHDFEKLDMTIQSNFQFVICNTIKGKGLLEYENTIISHYVKI